MLPEIISMGEVVVEFMRPLRGVPLYESGEFLGPFPSGAPANYIDAVARLGGRAGFIGVVGADDFGQLNRRRLQSDGVDVTHLRTAEGWTTGIAFVAYHTDGAREFIFHFAQSAAALLEPDDVDPEYLKGCKLLHISGSALSFSEASRDACYKAVEMVHSSGGRISFDPNLRVELLSPSEARVMCQPVLDIASIIFPGGEEAMLLTGVPDPEDACRALLASTETIEAVALKLGTVGSKVFTQAGDELVPSIKVDEVDPTGAGDAYAAGFTIAYLEGKSWRECARFANVVGAMAVTRFGPMEGLPWRSHVDQLLSED
jgi:sugar/nucleoside kinase (ribokinase family)